MADLVVVDDDAEMAELISDFLKEAGHEVRVACNGAEGLRLVHHKPPDAVLLDVEMPVLTGPAMAIAMCQHEMGLEKIPLILASGVSNLKAVAATVGTPYFLAKPYGFEALASLLATVLEEREPPNPHLMRRAS